MYIFSYSHLALDFIVIAALAIAQRHFEKFEGRKLVAMNSRAAAGGGKRFPILKKIISKKECELKDTGIRVRQALINYLENLK